jgi:hypothetical protein
MYTLSVLLTQTIKYSITCETYRFPAGQGSFRILWKLIAGFRNHKCSPLVPTLSHLNPFYTPHNTSWESIIILRSHNIPVPLQLSLSLNIPHQNLVHASLLSIRTTCPTHRILFDFITPTIPGTRSTPLSTATDMSDVYRRQTPLLATRHQQPLCGH